VGPLLLLLLLLNPRLLLQLLWVLQVVTGTLQPLLTVPGATGTGWTSSPAARKQRNRLAVPLLLLLLLLQLPALLFQLPCLLLLLLLLLWLPFLLQHSSSRLLRLPLLMQMPLLLLALHLQAGSFPGRFASLGCSCEQLQLELA
jgi:hypothetical protein